MVAGGSYLLFGANCRHSGYPSDESRRMTGELVRGSSIWVEQKISRTQLFPPFDLLIAIIELADVPHINFKEST